MITIFNNINIELKYFLYPILYILIGLAAYTFSSIIINSIFSPKKYMRKKYHQKRADTLRVMILNVIKYIIIIFVILSILTVFNVDVKSIIAGLGVTAIILGLALQDIAKDFFAGISIIAENLYEVGDTIEIGDFRGEVTSISLKTTKVKDFKGRIKIFNNRNITEVINYNMANSVAVVDVSIAYEENNNRVEKVLSKIIEDLNKNVKKLKGNVELLGINELNDSAVVYRIVAPVIPMEQFEVERQIRKEIKLGLDKANIKIPYKQIEVHNGKK